MHKDKDRPPLWLTYALGAIIWFGVSANALAQDTVSTDSDPDLPTLDSLLPPLDFDYYERIGFANNILKSALDHQNLQDYKSELTMYSFALTTYIALLGEEHTSVATIWDVSDASTLLFMQRYYHHLDNPEFGRAEALRQAQLDLLNHRVLSDKEQQGLFAKLFTADQNSSASEQFTAAHFETQEDAYGISDYSHPYFWAPFIMMGKWR